MCVELTVSDRLAVGVIGRPRPCPPGGCAARRQTIAETAAGMTPDEELWRSIYKYDDGSGGPYVTGWIAAFFAYLQTKNGPVFKGQHDIEDPFNWRRPMYGWGGGYRTNMFPSHVSTVPFVWDYFGTRFARPPCRLMGQAQAGMLRRPI